MNKLILFTSFLFLCSCNRSFHKTIDLKAEYEKEVANEEALQLLTLGSFSEGVFTDSRIEGSAILDSTYVGSVKRVAGFGVSSTFIYNNEEAIEALILSSLKDLVQYSGHIWTTEQEADFRIDIELYDLRPRTYKVLLSEDIEGYTKFKADFYSLKTGELVYSKVYENSNRVAAIATKDLHVTRIRRSLLSTILDIGRDKELEKTLSEYLSK